MDEIEVVAAGGGRKGKWRNIIDKSTVDKVLDHRVMDVLNKLSKRGVLQGLSGTFASGKEANVYTAECSTKLSCKFVEGEDGAERMVPVVLKIYKTSTMNFKDRERYFANEKRFTSFASNNSRKLVKLWAEKEVRNLKRIQRCGIKAPTPLYLKKSVLIMSMIGDAHPAPCIKDVNDAEWEKVYYECLEIISRLYKEAGLIHADFSEYNLVYYNHRVYVIDVAQSLEKNHENANSFLINDIRNCNEFFKKKNVVTESENDIFERITGLKIPKYLKATPLTKETFIPTRMSDVANEEDYELFLGANSADTSDNSTESDSSNTEETAPSENDVNEINLYIRKLSRLKPDASEEEQKEYQKKRKSIIKEMNRERRAQKADKKKERKDNKGKSKKK